ncbi:MAG: Fe-S protein assembly co-chaperone HscB [Bryobacteraceae bacterium]
MRYYEALGIDTKLVLDAEELKQRFYGLSRQWHPDRFARSGEAEKRKALDMTSLLNDAFRTLKDPITRAEYLLEENGMGPAKSAPPELLEEVFELNMALDELRDGDESARGQLTDARARFFGMRGEIDQDLAAMFANYDSAPSQDTLSQIRATLDRRRYISNLVRDVDKELNK